MEHKTKNSVSHSSDSRKSDSAVRTVNRTVSTKDTESSDRKNTNRTR